MADISAVDWELAARVGAGLIPAGPRASKSEVHALVAELRECARRVPELVASAAGLDEVGVADELVVDRKGAIRAAVDSARSMLTRLDIAESEYTLGEQIQAKVGAVALGSVLAILGSRILGQFDPFGSRARLILVAPNVMLVERQIGANPHDFRMWVCLHEQTHRAQFAHAPWLVDYLSSLAADIVEAEAEGVDWARLPSRIASAARADSGEARATSLRLVGAISSERTMSALDSITAVMSLLEGHADVMMDRAGLQQIPTLPKIRQALELRRARMGVASLVGKLIGMDAKLAQYQDGANFCRQVIDEAGVSFLNRAFRGVEDLPTITELHDPNSWLARQGDARQWESQEESKGKIGG